MVNMIEESRRIRDDNNNNNDNNNNVLAYYASKNLDAFTKILYTYIHIIRK